MGKRRAVLASVILGTALGLLFAWQTNAARATVARVAAGRLSTAFSPRIMWLRSPPMHSPAGLRQ
jgi:hypothetical protein